MNKYLKIILVSVACSVVFAIVAQWIFEGDLPFLPFPLLAGFFIVLFQKEIVSYKFLDKLAIGSLIFGFLTPLVISARAYLMSLLFYGTEFNFYYHLNQDSLFMPLAFSFIAFMGGLLGILIIGFYTLYKKTIDKTIIFFGALILTVASLFVSRTEISGTIANDIYGWPYPFLIHNFRDIVDGTLIDKWVFSPGSFYHYLIFNYLLYLLVLALIFFLLKSLNKILPRKVKIISVLFGVIVATAIALSSSQSIKQSYISSEIKRADYCDIDADCVIAGSKCPFGCAIIVNKNETGRIMRMVNTYSSNCNYSCAAECQKAICQNNRCQSVCQ